ncbi:MAG: ABC transporter ATP-binding protein, partial [Candidatus Methanomethylophilaceae archaeon]|nr:ABC transporter ATP-binding protein [Candidatus Methanomethylophilaceae archaeon]
MRAEEFIDHREGRTRHETMALLGRLLRTFGKYRWYIYLGTVLTLVCSVLSVIGPTYLSSMTNSVAESISEGTGVDVSGITWLAITLAAIYALAFLCNYLSIRLAWVAEEANGDVLRKMMSEKISRISVGILDTMRHGDVMSRVANDTDNIRSKGADCFVNMAAAVSMLIGCIIMMLITEWRLALLVMIPAAAGFAFIRLMVRWSQKYYRAQSKNLGRMNTLIGDVFDGLDVVNVYNGTEAAREDFLEINSNLYETAFKSRFVGSMMPQLSGFVNNIGYVVVCVAGC